MVWEKMRRGHGDNGAGRVLAQLYREHAAAVFAYAFHLVGSRQDAEDMVQTAFLHSAGWWA
jgi:DNA-directed RNA polymerase specialized sigma24 family protein